MLDDIQVGVPEESKRSKEDNHKGVQDKAFVFYFLKDVSQKN